MECSGTPAFGDMRLTLFCVSTTSALTHDVLQWVSFHPPIAICCALSSVRQPRLPFCDMKLTLFCLYRIWPSTRRFSGCECSLPSPLKFVMECSATLAFLWHETNYFGVSLFWYLHNSAAFYMKFFSVWVLTQSPLKFVMECSATPAFLWHETNSFLCLYRIWPSTRRFSVCECSLPSPLKFVMECSATQRILTHFLFVFVCRRWVHPVSVTMRSSPIPLFCFLSVPSVRQRRLPFGDMKLTFFVSLPLLAFYTTFFSMWVLTPIPMQICYGLLSNACLFVTWT
jgi:hypothetical protein